MRQLVVLLSLLLPVITAGQLVTDDDSYADDFIASANNGTAPPCDIYSCSYGQLAEARVYNSFSKLTEEMRPLVHQPSAIVVNDKYIKNLRKHVEQTRDYLDLFAYAYGPGNDTKNDLFLVIRDKLSLMHHDIGKFNDIIKRIPEPGEVEERRAEIHEELKSFVYLMDKPETISYLRHPLLKEFYERPGKLLSRLFWSPVPDELPSLAISGLQNMAGLCKVYIETIDRSWSNVKEWDSKTLKRYHDDVHDVRKEIRALNYTSSFFPEVWVNATLAKQHSHDLRLFYDAYSEVQTHLELFIYYVRERKRRQAEDEAKQMQEAWDRLQSWQAGLNDDRRLPALLHSMVENVVNVPPVEPSSLFPGWARIMFFLLLPFGLVLGSVYAYRSFRKDFARSDGYALIE